MLHHKKKVYHWYPFLVILYGVTKLIESFLVTIPATWDVYANIFVNLSMGWLVFNLILLIRFLWGRFETAALVLPIYYIIDYLLSLAFGYILAAQYGFTSLEGQSWFISLTAVFVLFEIGFGLYLIFRRH